MGGLENPLETMGLSIWLYDLNWKYSYNFYIIIKNTQKLCQNAWFGLVRPGALSKFSSSHFLNSAVAPCVQL